MKQVEGAKSLSDVGCVRHLFDGGARSGKTLSIMRFLYNRGEQYPGSRQLCARLHLSDCRATTWDSMKGYVSEYVPSDRYRLYHHDSDVVLWNGSVIHFDGLDDKERVDKILGSEWLTIFVNEATQTSYQTIQTLCTRLAQRVRHVQDDRVYGLPKLLIDCNPKHRRHWIHKYCIENVDPVTGAELPDHPVDPLTGKKSKLHYHFQRVHWTPFDNKENLPPDFFVTLNNLPLVLRNRMLNGVWCDNEGAVYSAFDEDVHVCDPFPVPGLWRRWRAVDFGYTSPFCCLWVAQDPEGRLYVYDEHYVAQQTVAWHARKIEEKSHGDRYVATLTDWEAEQRAQLESHGIGTMASDKSLLPGVDRVKQRLELAADGLPRLFVFSSCVNTITEFQAYMYPEGARPEQEDAEPVDEYNHALDPLRYVVNHVDSGIRTSAFSRLKKPMAYRRAVHAGW